MKNPLKDDLTSIIAKIPVPILPMYKARVKSLVSKEFKTLPKKLEIVDTSASIEEDSSLNQKGILRNQFNKLPFAINKSVTQSFDYTKELDESRVANARKPLQSTSTYKAPSKKSETVTDSLLRQIAIFNEPIIRRAKKNLANRMQAENQKVIEGNSCSVFSTPHMNARVKNTFIDDPSHTDLRNQANKPRKVSFK